jgi:hypothetical protein
MDPAKILTREDYESPRTLEEFVAWWDTIHNSYAITKEGRGYAREGKGLAKRFYDEAHPMLAYMRQHPPAPLIRCQILAGDGEADSVYLDPSSAVVRKFQITVAIDGRTEKLRLRQLTRDGHVDALAKLNENDEIPQVVEDDEGPNAPAAYDHLFRVEEMAAQISAALEKKIAKGYGPDFTLIVGFSDSTFDPDDVPVFRQHVSCPVHSFSEIHIMGVLGRVGWVQHRQK